MSSWLFLETDGTQSPVSEGKDSSSDADTKEKVCDGLNEKKKKKSQQEVNLKKINASLASLEKYKEQLKAVKKKVQLPCSFLIAVVSIIVLLREYLTL